MEKYLKSINSVKNELQSAFTMKYLGEISYILGIKVQRNRQRRSLTMSQEKYVKKILERFNMQNSKPAYTPASKTKFPEAEPDQEEITYPYREAVGALMFAATTTRPDIMSAVASVARFSSSPSVENMVAVKRVLRYLRGSTDMKLILGGSSSLTLESYADADWGNDDVDRRYNTGFVCFYGGC